MGEWLKQKIKRKYMILVTFVLSLLAGLILANGVPHFVKGITGEMHATPFGRPSSAATNVFWGWLNFVVGFILLNISRWQWYPKTAFLGLALGSLIIGLMMAAVWSKHPEHNHSKE
jgi:hypothetical protein